MTETRTNYVVTIPAGWLPDEGELTKESAVLKAVGLLYDASEFGPDAFDDALEALMSAWEQYSNNGRPVPCGICHRLECSH